MEQRNTERSMRQYFGCANTGDGFFSLFGEIFSPEKLSRIYILKGGPGCGKSTLLEGIADEAGKRGYATECYRCSSDPSSFDGVVIPALSVGVFDGTAPHAAEPALPAVCESIVNLAEGFDRKEAAGYAGQIKELYNGKKDAYAKAYAYLSACREASRILSGCASECLLAEKLEGAVGRMLSRLPIKGEGKVQRVFTDCIGTKGEQHLFTFEDMAENHIFVRDCGETAPLFFDVLLRYLSSSGADFTQSLSVLDPGKTVGIYLPSCDTAFTLYDDTYALLLERKQKSYKIVNMARFCDAEKQRAMRSFTRYALRCRNDLLAGAKRELEKAGKLHAETEALYHCFCDYGVVTRLGEELKKEIFEQ